MKKGFSLLIKAILIALIIAELPSNATNDSYITIGQNFNASMIYPLMPGYNLGSLPMISLSGINPSIFKSPAFAKDAGGLSANLYTSSINNFLSGDKEAGMSNIAKKPLRLGMLVGWEQNNSALGR